MKKRQKKETGEFGGLLRLAAEELGAALRSIKARWRDRLGDRRLGISTAEIGEAVAGGRHRDSCGYSPTSYSHLGALAAFLALKDDDVFFDVGCGRGRVVCFMAAQGAGKIVGLEIIEEFVEQSKAHAAAVASRGGADIVILRCDAAAVPPAVIDEGTVFFLHSPFGFRTLRDFVDGVGESLRRRPRALTVVYYKPTHRWYLDDRPWLAEDPFLSRFEIMVWRGRPDRA